MQRSRRNVSRHDSAYRGAIASHSAGQCEWERVCSIHNLACSVTSTVKTCHLWKEKPPKKVRDMVPLTGQHVLASARLVRNLISDRTAFGTCVGTVDGYECLLSMYLWRCSSMCYHIVFRVDIYIHTPSSNTTSTLDCPLLCDTSFVSLRAILSLTLCVDG